ncbi:MAG: 4-hydroxybenzoate octaprenyltransferase [Hyphomonadaceae bacterium]|nr:MAG: 4-hydroxybenzoate octaprenyltransferase [Caulobacteraceae bacterium]MBT9445945.1 4-hydroxybenzoate octaprenyltransferase [Hyphomonadaceae bacterium]TPW08075.1 MAG: 4-hydroxybenzoate octaprenyltransferase [Alphaproteobacteria bacterium]
MTTLKPADALAQHWTDRLPAALKPFAQLSRLDRPIGWQLLFLPCLMGIALAETQEGFWLEDGWLALRLLIGAIAMRGAGCTWNDILDRKIDAEVARTRSRPIPSGRVSVRGAISWMAAQCGVGLLVLLSLPTVAQWTALAAIPLVALYPLMKRVTWWPQAWLGLCFSWGALVASAAVRGTITADAIALYAGCIAWTIAYDTIYALQDVEDDALVGVRSTARLFGARWRDWTLGFYVTALVLWAVAAALAGSLLVTGVGLGVIGATLIWRAVADVDEADTATALKAFKANAVIGLAVAGAFALAGAWRTVGPFLGAP